MPSLLLFLALLLLLAHIEDLGLQGSRSETPQGVEQFQIQQYKIRGDLLEGKALGDVAEVEILHVEDVPRRLCVSCVRAHE